jgi:hypothetical protein
LGTFDTGDSIFSGTWGKKGLLVWEKAAGGGKKDVWNDTSKGRINEDELETADEQTSKVDRKGGFIPGTETKRGAKHIKENEGMGEFIFYVYR